MPLNSCFSLFFIFIYKILVDIVLALRVATSKEQVQSQTGNKKRWNSSVKVDKRRSIKPDGNIQKSTVRKVLNFQTKPKVHTPLIYSTFYLH